MSGDGGNQRRRRHGRGSDCSVDGGLSTWDYSCGVFDFGLEKFDEPADAFAVDNRKTRTAKRWLRISGIKPAGAWRTLGSNKRNAEYARGKPGTRGGITFISIFWDGRRDVWTMGTVGGCQPNPVLPGPPSGTRTLNPERPEPTATSTRIRALVQEQVCASGKPPGKRVRAPFVAYEPDRFVIVARVKPPKGDQTCPGAPPSPYTFRLDEPIGDREVVDGQEFPFAQRLDLRR